MGQKLAGIVDLKINGESQKVMGTVDWSMGGKERTPMEGNEHHGFTSKIVASELTLKIVMAVGTSLNTLTELEGATLVIATDIGITLVLPNAYSKTPVAASVGSGDNEVTVVFGGDKIEEL